MKFQSPKKPSTKLQTGVCAALGTLFLSGCIQDSDFEKLKAKKVDGWTYISSNSPEGHTNSSSASMLPKNEHGNLVYAAFECHNNTNLHLHLETFNETIYQAKPIKMRYAKSAFGRFAVVDIKAVNHHSKFTLLAQGSNQNTAAISLHPGVPKLSQWLISPDLILTIPTEPSSSDITIPLANPNIKQVFQDCGFKPAFMMAD